MIQVRKSHTSVKAVCCKVGYLGDLGEYVFMHTSIQVSESYCG